MKGNDNFEMALHDATAKCTKCHADVQREKTRLAKLVDDEAMEYVKYLLDNADGDDQRLDTSLRNYAMVVEADGDPIAGYAIECFAAARMRWICSAGRIAVTKPGGVGTSSKRFCHRHAGLKLHGEDVAASQERSRQATLHTANAPWAGSSMQGGPGVEATSQTPAGRTVGDVIDPTVRVARSKTRGYVKQVQPYAKKPKFGPDTEVHDG